MNYIKRNNDKIIVDNKELDMTFSRYLKHLSLCNFKTINDIRKTTKINCNIKYTIPLYINKNILLVYTGSLNSIDIIALNYFNITNIISNDYSSLIIFKDGMSIKINISPHRIKTMMEKGRIVFDYVTKNNI